MNEETTATTPTSSVDAKPEAAKPRAAKPKVAKPKAAKPEAAKPKAAKPKAAKPSGANAGTSPRGPDMVAMRAAAERIKMVADGSRMAILMILSSGEVNVMELCRMLDNQSQPAISHHLALLRHGRLVEPRRDGKHNFYRLTSAGAAIVGVVSQLIEG